MGECHLARLRELETDLRHGRLAADEVRRVLENLVDLTSLARESLQQMDEASCTPYVREYSRARAGLAVLHKQLTTLQAEAETDFKVLIKLPQEERQLRIARAVRKYRNPVLVDLLVEESYRKVSRAPHQALEIAECAHAVALRIPADEVGESWTVTCIARAAAHRGNAIRATNNFRDAEPLLELAQDLFTAKGSGDPIITAEIAYLLASLRRDQRRFGEAEALLFLAAKTYAELEDPRGTADVLIKLSTVYSQMGEPTKALDSIRRAVPLLDEQENAYLYLVAIHNQAHYLADLGRFSECQELLFAHADLYQALGIPALKVRLRWILGKVDHGLGNETAAEEAFLAVRSHFTAEGLAYDAALAGLDLALVYVEQRQPARIRHLAEEMIPVFMAQDIERETLAALMLFQEAARHEAVTDSMLTELSRYMKRARRKPAPGRS